MKTLLCSLASAQILFGLMACSNPGRPLRSDLYSAETIPGSELTWERARQATPNQNEVPRLRRGDTSVPVGIGFTRDPDLAVLGVAFDSQLNSYMSLGPQIQFGANDDRFLFSGTFQIKSYLNTVGPQAEPSRLQPFLQGGIGWSWLDDDRAGHGDDNSFLLNGGAGLWYRLNPRYSLGTGLMLNFVPGKLDDERFYVTWEVLQLVFHF